LLLGTVVLLWDTVDIVDGSGGGLLLLLLLHSSGSMSIRFQGSIGIWIDPQWCLFQKLQQPPKDYSNCYCYRSSSRGYCCCPCGYNCHSDNGGVRCCCSSCCCYNGYHYCNPNHTVVEYRFERVVSVGLLRLPRSWTTVTDRIASTGTAC
jgi:hypothetical protein